MCGWKNNIKIALIEVDIVLIWLIRGANVGLLKSIQLIIIHPLNQTVDTGYILMAAKLQDP